MRRTLHVFLFLSAIFFCQVLHAQTDSSLTKRVNQLLQSQLPSASLQVDSLVTKEKALYVFFNIDRRFAKGDISETAAEDMMELLTHLTEETGTNQLYLLARDQQTNEWKTLDYFTNMAPVVPYKPVPNNDPYPDSKGRQTAGHAKVFPGGGQAGIAGPLAGKTVWLSPGHGWHNTGSGFTTQRGTSFQLVEDFITAESMDYYLVHYLMNAGANVWSVRERDMNPREVIVNNDQGAPGYTETGAWADGSIAGYGGTYRTSSADAAETATAVFTPVIDSSALYWVSVRFIAGTNRATDVKYTITHAGGTTTYTVNQEVHSDTWIYLGQFYFFAGGNYKVTISNASAESGQAIVADAVRFGGGTGQQPDCTNGGAPSGRPRFEEAARQYANYQGYPTCREDVTMRPVYTEWELSKGAPTEINEAIFVSWHTNAAGGTGTETYIYNGGGASQPIVTAGSLQLRDSVQKQIISDLRAGWNPSWADRTGKTANFGELRELRTIPGILIELAFHDRSTDASALKTPEFRRMAARAIYKGIVKFYNYKSGTPIQYLPEEPRQVVAKNTGSSQIEVSWIAPLTGGIYGDAATGYRIYFSENGKGFDNGTAVSGTSYTFSGVAGKTYFFRVSATNAGGESFASSVVAARTPSGAGTADYLIVDGFDRLDSSSAPLRVESAALGSVRRVWLEKMNRYDYMVEHGNALGSCNLSFDGAQNDAVVAGAVNLSDYPAVDWYAGEESTGDRSLDNTEKQKISTYLDNGGRLLLSGSEIAWDLGRAASVNADLAFFNNYIRAVYVGDGAGTYNFSGTPSFFTGSTGTFSNGLNGYYNVDFPDRLNGNAGSSVILTYTGGTNDGAGVGYQGNYNLLYFGFPIEAIVDPTVRNTLMCQSATYLAAPLIPLPVTGLTLTAVAKGTANELSWVTQSEINTSHFVVERSVNGIDYTVIGQPVQAKGINGEGAAYRFTDEQALSFAYYRIRAVDIDTKKSYSNIVMVRNAGQRLLYIVQNPVQYTIHLRTLTGGRMNVILTNTLGQVILSNNYRTAAGQMIDIPASGLAKGIYWLSATTEGYTKESYKLVVQ